MQPLILKLNENRRIKHFYVSLPDKSVHVPLFVMKLSHIRVTYFLDGFVGFIMFGYTDDIKSVYFLIALAHCIRVEYSTVI